MSLLAKKGINAQITSFELLKIVKFRILSFLAEHRIPAITLFILLLGIVYSWTKLFFRSKAANSKKLSPYQDGKESVAIGFEREFGETAVYRHASAVQGFKNYLENGRIQTIFDLMRYCRMQFADRDYLGSRSVNADGSLGQFEFLTYDQSYELSLQLAQGLASLGARSGDRIGFYSANCMEWKLAEGACYQSNLVVVSLYDSLGPNAVEYILSHATLKIVFCSHKTFQKLIQAIDNMKYNSPIQHIILFKTNHGKQVADPKDLQKAKDLNVQVHSLEEILKIGSLSEFELNPPTKESIATIMYTSGTTGEPKGVLLTHGNMISSISGFGIEERKDEFVTNLRSYLSYLPLAHIMERTTLYTVAYFGGKIGFYSGDIMQITSDFLTLQPTDAAGVPRTYQKIYDKIMQVVEHTDPWSKWLFKTAYRAKQKALKEGKDTPLYNRFVFDGIRDQVFGSRIERLLCGSAPLSEELHEFLRIIFSVTVIEGYGLTETSAGATSCEIPYLQKHVPAGRVGSPLRCVELKLVDVPEMGYTSQDKPFPRGEICLRGGCVFKGYYNDPEKTKEAFDANGWFRTGDIGKIGADGTLTIIDRKKNIFKLNQGEYIAPDYLENVYCRASLVSQCFIYGDSRESCLVAVVVPDTEAVESWAEVNRKKFDLEILCNDPKLKMDVLRSMQRVAKESGLMGYEVVRAVHLESEPWTLQNNLLTPTFKLRRGECKAKYENEVKRLYEEVKQNFSTHASSRS